MLQALARGVSEVQFTRIGPSYGFNLRNLSWSGALTAVCEPGDAQVYEVLPGSPDVCANCQLGSGYSTASL